MTCIVGVRTVNGVLLGGDSAGVNGYLIQPVARPKVFCLGEYLIGYTTSFRMGQVLECSFSPPEFPDRADVYTEIVRKFIPAIRECFKAAGFASVKDGVESGGKFLVSLRGRLFQVASDYQAFEPLDAFSAVGCGEEFALGSLHASEEIGLLAKDPRAAVITALKAAARFSAGVREPFHVVGECAPGKTAGPA